MVNLNYIHHFPNMESSSIVSSVKGLRRGAWAAEEDLLLRKCIMKYGEGKWGQVPLRAGLNRCRKSCRLRWLNYLQPDIKRGVFEPDEVDLITRMHKLLGNRWSLIAGRIPGRTANDIKNYYNTHLKNTKKTQQAVVSLDKSGRDISIHHTLPCTKFSSMHDMDVTHMMAQVLRPQPRIFSRKPQWNMNNVTTPTEMNTNNNATTANNNFQVVKESTIAECLPVLADDQLSPTNDQQACDESTHWLKNILFGDAEEEDSKKRKKMEKSKRKKQITSNNNATLESGNTSTTFGVEEGILSTKAIVGVSDVYNCNFDGGGQGLAEGGNIGDGDHYWNSYFDDNLWSMLGEEQDQYLMI